MQEVMTGRVSYSRGSEEIEIEGVGSGKSSGPTPSSGQGSRHQSQRGFGQATQLHDRFDRRYPGYTMDHEAECGLSENRSAAGG